MRYKYHIHNMQHAQLLGRIISETSRVRRSMSQTPVLSDGGVSKVHAFGCYPQCLTPDLYRLLQTVSPQEGEPMSLVRAEPGQTPRLKVQPSGDSLMVEPGGVALGQGPGNSNPGEGHQFLDITFSMQVVSIALSLVRHPGPVFLERPYKGANARNPLPLC